MIFMLAPCFYSCLGEHPRTPFKREQSWSQVANHAKLATLVSWSIYNHAREIKQLVDVIVTESPARHAKHLTDTLHSHYFCILTYTLASLKQSRPI